MPPPITHPESRLVLLPYAALALVTVLTLGWMLHYASYGLDFTDEGFYLNWLRSPGEYAVSPTQFGFVYHLLYVLLDGDIAALRRANILLTFGLAWGLSHGVLRYSLTAAGAGALWRPIQGLCTSGALACGALAAFNNNLLTPNYNTLNLQALTLTLWGVVLALHPQRRAWLCGLVIGVGGALCFLAKPTSAIILGLLAFLCLAGRPRRNLPVLVIAVAVAACSLLLAAIGIDGTPTAFLERLQRTQHSDYQLGGGHDWLSLLKIDTFVLEPALFNHLVQLALLTAALTALACFDKKLIRSLAIAGSLALGVTAVALSLGNIPITLPGSLFHGMLGWGIVLGLLPATLYYLAKVGNQTPQLDPVVAALLITLLCLPHAYAFGTNNQYWNLGGFALYFWILGGVLLFVSARALHGKPPALLPAAAATQLLTVVMVGTGLTQPYRQPALIWTNTHPVAVGNTDSRLTITADAARYLEALTRDATQAGFLPDTPLIDLTGQSPTVLYALQAKPTGSAWLIGGYSLSGPFAINMLRLESCDDLAQAWLLREPEGPRSLPDTLTQTLGLGQIEQDFAVVAKLDTPPGAGGYPESRRQQLLKPVRPAQTAEASCLRSRSVPSEH
ncbi:hypothetical protein [Orrella dioscoreae]|uniref:Transmembrane protein n=1 Tax=Orrella dioscoreae TaxID=1851544 RepID=A0A1C3K676_9BURK|nr:hypothetical protein [Orrella dioscoreae]SBT26982.1 hypothetical protein ODI_01107 [Orrella dioscoreae]SOE52602.1 hypothetical protein ODI_R4330 [Orrella dioscoreae]